MSNAHGTGDLIHILSAFASAPKRRKFNVFRPNGHFPFGNFRDDIKEGEGRLTQIVRIERRLTDEPVHACFMFQMPECVVSFHADRHMLISGLLTAIFIENFRGPSLVFRIAEVHAEEHPGPILRLGSSSAGREGHDRRGVIVGSGKKCEAFKGSEFTSEMPNRDERIFFYRRIRLGFEQFKEIARFYETGTNPRHAFNSFCKLRALPLQFRRAPGITPNIRRREVGIECGNLFVFFRNVKDGLRLRRVSAGAIGRRRVRRPWELIGGYRMFLRYARKAPWHVLRGKSATEMFYDITAILITVQRHRMAHFRFRVRRIPSCRNARKRNAENGSRRT